MLHRPLFDLEMGFSPVATLADKQSTGLFGPTDKLRCNFLPILNPISVKQKATRVEPELPLAWSWKWDLNPRSIATLVQSTKLRIV